MTKRSGVSGSRGPKKDAVAAELVAAMYDASLDQFLPHSWSGMRFPGYYHRIHFAGSGFRAVSGDIRHNPTGIPQPPFRTPRGNGLVRFSALRRAFPGMPRDGGGSAVHDEGRTGDGNAGNGRFVCPATGADSGQRRRGRRC
ncbi:MAG: hypothetical protein IPM98_11540 [Lewinellaceae bacterium]|nr:hypothetical protein [Lewinellaceae bacterium]